MSGPVHSLQHPDAEPSVRSIARDRPAVLPYIYATILILCFAWVYSLIFDEDLEMVGDNAAYYILGKSLYMGEGYRYINSPEAPPAARLPPGYPVLIALTMTLWSSDFAAVKLVNGLAFGLAVVAAFYLFGKLSGNVHLAFVAAMAMLCNGHLLRFSTLMMSESSFLLCAVLALLVGSHIAEENFKRPHIYLLVLCLIAAFYIRTMGIALLGAVCLVLVWHRWWRYLAFVAAGYVLAVVPWYLRGRRLQGDSYIDQLLSVNPFRPELGKVGLGDLALRLLSNAERYLTLEVPDGLLYYITSNDNLRQVTTATTLLSAALLLLAAYGLYTLKRLRLLTAAYVGATGGILLLWPEVVIGTRFLQPLIPLLLLGIFNGLWTIARALLQKRHAARSVYSLILAPLLLVFLHDIEYLSEVATEAVYPKPWINYFAAARWIEHNTAPDAVVACRKPNMFYLYANRRTVVYAFTLKQAELVEDLEQKGVDYVVLEQLGYSSTGRYLAPAIGAHPHRFTRVYNLDDPATWVMEFLTPH